MVRKMLCFELLELMHQRLIPKCHMELTKVIKFITKEGCSKFGLDAKQFLCHQLQYVHSKYVQQSDLLTSIMGV